MYADSQPVSAWLSVVLFIYLLWAYLTTSSIAQII